MTPEEKLINEMYNMSIDRTMFACRQILYNPTKEQTDKFWCKKCDGFHNTKKHRPRIIQLLQKVLSILLLREFKVRWIKK